MVITETVGTAKMTAREIKFRAWYEGEMVTPIMVSENGKAIYVDGIRIEEFTNVPIMQYTGLIDKNGTDIYEADIVENSRGLRGEVVYRMGQFCVDAANQDGSEKDHWIGAYMNGLVEVVGNKFEVEHGE